MSNIISLNITSRTFGGKSFVHNLFTGTKNSTVYSPAVVRGFDTHDIISTIRNNGTNSYFTTREWTRMETSSKKDEQIIWSSSDSLSTIAATSNNFVLLTVLFRDAVRQVNMKSEQMIFDINKMMTGAALIPDPASSGTIFEYVEEGNPNPMQYTVVETIAQIIAQGGGSITPPAMNGYELYVNDVVGDDTSAQFGNPLRPWATVDAAVIAAKPQVAYIGYPITIIITGGAQAASNNIFADGVNFQIENDAELQIDVFTPTGQGNQYFSGKGSVSFQGGNAYGIHADTTFSGLINFDVGSITFNPTTGILNQSLVGGVININCDYSNMGANCKYMYAITGTSPGSFKTHIQHVDQPRSANAVSTFFINPSTTSSASKVFNFYLASGNSNSSNEGLLCVSGIDSTYLINAELNVNYNGGTGTIGVNSVLSCISCTGGVINLKGTNYIPVAGRHAMVLNSAVTINDYSNSYQQGANINESIILAGGTSIYTLYGKHLSLTHTNAITLGNTFTSSNATSDFGTPTGTAGTDTLHFKGGLKCAYANNAAVGILVANANPNLIIDGGIIEMVNSNTANSAIDGAGAQNMKVFGAGFVRGAITNMTNTISGGVNIIQDSGVTVNI